MQKKSSIKSHHKRNATISKTSDFLPLKYFRHYLLTAGFFIGFTPCWEEVPF